MEQSQLISSAVIIAICNWIGSQIKKADKPKLNSWIPLILIITGGILGGICHFIFPEYILGLGLYQAIFTGLISGGLSVTTNQIAKQASYIKEDSKSEYTGE